MMRSKRNFYISWAKLNNIQFPVPGKQKLMIIEELIIYHFSYTQRGLILTPPASEAFQEVTNQTKEIQIFMKSLKYLTYLYLYSKCTNNKQ